MTFLACLAVSALLWLINALNRNYNRTLAIPVKFTNLPQNKVPQRELPKFIMAEVRTSGAKLVKLLIKRDLEEITIDVAEALRKKNQKLSAIHTYSAVGNLSRHLNTEVEVIKVKPDSIYFFYGKNYQKSIPIKAKLDVDYDPLYKESGRVSINPAFVMVQGDSEAVMRIDTLLTERIVLNKLNKDVNQKARILLPEELAERISLSSDEVNISVKVDKFTEAELEVPVTALNLQDGDKLKTFPDKIRIRYQVPFKDFETVKPNLFKAIVNPYQLPNGAATLKVEIIQQPANVKITRVLPEKVEYILRRNTNSKQK